MNKEMLLEDLKFPLKWDSKSYKMYIFDSDMNMVAQVDMDLDATVNKHPFEKLIGNYKEPKVNYGVYKVIEGDFINILTLETAGLVRGWGGLKYKDSPEERQDNIAEYIY